MATLDASQVRQNGSITGAIYTAPLGSTAPTDAVTAPDAAFTPLGFVSEDGVEEVYNDSTTAIKAWQGATTVRTLITDQVVGATFSLLQTNKSSLETFHRGAVVTGAASAWELDLVPVESDRRMWIIDAVDGLLVTRLFFADAEVVERESIVHSNNDIVMYGLTLTAYLASGSYGKKFSNDDNWGAS